MIKESRQLAHPKLKFQFDVFILADLALLVIKLVVFLLKKITAPSNWMERCCLAYFNILL